MNIQQFIYVCFITLIFTTFIISCSRTEERKSSDLKSFHKPYLLHIEQDSINLEWSADPLYADSIEHFLVHYRVYPDSSLLHLLHTVPGTTNNCIIQRSSLPVADSIFEFAIIAVNKRVDTSTVLLSREFQQSYEGGWVIFWK
jgi:hypothetical protein